MTKAEIVKEFRERAARIKISALSSYVQGAGDAYALAANFIEENLESLEDYLERLEKLDE